VQRILKLALCQMRFPSLLSFHAHSADWCITDDNRGRKVDKEMHAKRKERKQQEEEGKLFWRMTVCAETE
jgi:hypothetical protein